MSNITSNIDKTLDAAHEVASNADSIKNEIVSFAKSKLFDLIGVAICVAILAISLGVLDTKEVTKDTFIDFLIECVPFYLSALLLTTNYYTKGKYRGKGEQVYLNAVHEYSKELSVLTGAQIEKLSDFCDYYNDMEIVRLQKNILRQIGMSHDTFVGLLDKSKDELLKLYSKDKVRVILLAKSVKVKGLSVSILTGNTLYSDNTNIGPTEKQLEMNEITRNVATYVIVIALLTVLTVKNILEWGWAGVLFVLFKLLYIVATSYMKFFTGYNDITIKMTNQYNRKIDLLKQFKNWFDKLSTGNEIK